MRRRPVWQVIADAWTPYVGERIASERARNAAQVLVGLDLAEEYELLLEALSTMLYEARRPQYGSIALDDEALAAAVQDALDALVAEGWLG